VVTVSWIPTLERLTHEEKKTFTRSSFGVWSIESSPMSCWLPEASAL
jgi:hypothetical protein